MCSAVEGLKCEVGKQSHRLTCVCVSGGGRDCQELWGFQKGTEGGGSTMALRDMAAVYSGAREMPCERLCSADKPAQIFCITQVYLPLAQRRTSVPSDIKLELHVQSGLQAASS